MAENASTTKAAAAPMRPRRALANRTRAEHGIACYGPPETTDEQLEEAARLLSPMRRLGAVVARITVLPRQ
ncbi:MAG TPA: hypothetical protein VD962_09865 [Rubricoccaceae bacterium]|nr:hypothetical protein [Rubricoccaceae bacterium]